MLEQKQNKKGFTLIELLVVIAIIAMLLAILMPSLKAAKKIAQGVVCTSNMRGMALAAILYTDNNDSRFPRTAAGDTSAPPPAPGQEDRRVGWVMKPADVNRNSLTNAQMANATLEDRVRGIEDGQLYAYVEDHKLYHCPGDRRFSLQFHNYLSYSMPGGIPNKREKISIPDSRYIFVEESDPRPYFSGDWDLLWDEPTPNDEGWWDGLAIWHNNASTFAFADGHAEGHKWRDDYTRERAGWTYEELMAPPQNGSYGKFPYGGHQADYNYVRNDLDWMINSHPGKGAR